MEDSMIDIPNMVFDEKIGNKRVRDGEEEFNTGRLEKRPSGILGVNGGADYIKDGGDEGEESGGGGDSGGGIIDTFLSNVFHKNENGIKEQEDDGQVKNNVLDVVEDKGEDLGGGGAEGHDVDSGNGGGVGGCGSEGGDGGGIINSFFSNIFHRSEGGDDGGNDGDHVGENSQDGGGGGGYGDGGELENLNAEKQVEKNDKVLDSSTKDLEGQKLKMKPDEYSERVFFLNNN